MSPPISLCGAGSPFPLERAVGDPRCLWPPPRARGAAEFRTYAAAALAPPVASKPAARDTSRVQTVRNPQLLLPIPRARPGHSPGSCGRGRGGGFATRLPPMPALGTKLRRSAISASPVLIAILMGLVLVVSSALSYRDASNATVLVAERQGDGFLRRLERLIGHKAPRAAALHGVLGANHALGLRY